MSRSYPRVAFWCTATLLASSGVLVGGTQSVAAASGSSTRRSASVTRLRLGAPTGHTPMARQNARRDGRAQAPLPQRPALNTRVRIQGGIIGAPVADGQGHLIVSSAGSRLVEVGLDGKTRWSVSTGSTPPASGPVLTSDGTRVVITTDARVLGFDSSGRRRFATKLPGSGSIDLDPLALPDGGLLVARGKDLLHVGRRGSVQARTRATAPPRQLLALGLPLFITADGSVYRWRFHEQPRKLGSLGGRVAGGAALVDAEHLMAVVESRRLVVLNLSTGARDQRVRLPGLSLAPHVTVTKDGGSILVTRSGLLLEHDAKGKERRRAALEPISSIPVAGSRSSATNRTRPGAGGIATTGRSPEHSPPIVDSKGTVAFVRSGLDAGVLHQDGSIQRAEGAFCAEPTAVVSVGQNRFASSCSSGLLFVIGSKP